MFTNCNAVTIYEKTVGADGFPAYLAHSIRMVYWEQCTGQTANQTAQKSTMTQNHSIYLAIPAASLSDYLNNAIQSMSAARRNGVSTNGSLAFPRSLESPCVQENDSVRNAVRICLAKSL